MEKDAFTRWGFRACLDCGDSIAPQEDEHACSEQRYQEFQVNLALPGLERIDLEFSIYLASCHGQFEVYYAGRERRLGRI